MPTIKAACVNITTNKMDGRVDKVLVKFRQLGFQPYRQTFSKVGYGGRG